MELRECGYCKVKHAIDAKYCEICSRPLDVADALQMEKESDERTKSLVYELMRKERAKKSTDKENIVQEKKLKEQQEKIKQLEKIIQSISKV